MSLYPPNPNAPLFDPSAWNNDQIDPKGSNCFQYAVAGSRLDGKNNVYDESIPNPGMTAGFFETDNLLNPTTFLNRVALDGLRIMPSKTVPPATPGHYLVGVYLEPRDPNNPKGPADFHWVRQDSDGGWSEKPGTGTQVQRFLRPAEDGGYRALPERYYNTGYKLLGYVSIPTAGRDMGIEASIAEELAKNPQSTGVAAYIQSFNGEVINRVSTTMTLKYPQVAPLFDMAVEKFYTDRTHEVIASLKKQSDGKSIKHMLANNDDRALDIIQSRVAAQDPVASALLQHVVYNIYVEKDAKNADDLIRQENVPLLTSQLQNVSPERLRDITAAFRKMDPNHAEAFEHIVTTSLNKKPRSSPEHQR